MFAWIQRGVASLLIVSLMVLPASAFQKGGIELQESQFEVALEASAIVYNEPGIMSETGEMYGVSGAYIGRRDTNSILNYFKLDGKFSYGQVDYDGTGEIEDIDDTMFEVRGVVGHDLVSGGFLITPYVGLGYRYLFDDLGVKTSTSGALGYDRTSEYFYAPIGVDASYHFESGWVIGLVAEYDYFIAGQQTSELSQVGLADFENDQDEGWGARAAVRITKKGEKIDFFVEPYLKYWEIEDSDPDSVVLNFNGTFLRFTGIEPENESTEAGIKFGIVF